MKLKFDLSENGVINSFCIIIALLMIKNIMFVLPYILVHQLLINIIVVSAVLLLFTYRVPFFVKNNRNLFIIIVAFFTVFVILEYLFFPENRSFFLEVVPKAITYGLIPFIFILTIDNYEALIDKMHITSIVILVFALWGFSGFFLHLSDATYSMSYGDAITIAILIFELYALQKHQLFDILCFFVSALIGVIMGSRIVLVEIVAFFFLYYFLLEKGFGIKRIISLVFVAMISLAGFFNYQRIIEVLIKTTTSFGLSSRSFTLLANGSFFDMGGRSYIYSICIDQIKRHPFIGIGCEGLKGIGYAGWTPHNTYLELITYNGCFVGGLSIILLLVIWCNGLFFSRDKALRCLIVISACLYIPRSFIGAGILDSMPFWLLLGFGIKSLIVARRK